jgi:hypothetical protein
LPDASPARPFPSFCGVSDQYCKEIGVVFVAFDRIVRASTDAGSVRNEKLNENRNIGGFSVRPDDSYYISRKTVVSRVGHWRR